MKVIHLINNLSAGGAELHLFTLCRHMKRQGVEVVVVTLKERAFNSRLLRPDFEEEGIRVIHLHADSRYNWRFPMRVARLLKKERPDLLHTHLPRADFAGAISHMVYRTIPWISSVHAIYRRHWSGRWSLPLFNIIWSRAEVLIAISNAVKEWLIKERHIPSDKINVIHYGIEPERFDQPRSNLRNSWGLNKRVLIGSIGRLEAVKGHDILIRAMPLILTQIPHATLLIAGKGLENYSRDLQMLINALKLNGHVRLIGFQSDIPSFLHALDVFAFATRSEGFGQVIIEAMATGKPVVASNIPPITEIIADGTTGFLVEPEKPEAFARAIIELLKQPAKSIQIGKQGQERVRELFSAEKMTTKIKSLYEEIIAKKC